MRGRISGGPNLAAPMILIIESGAIYSVCLLTLIILYASGSFAQYIVFDAVTQIIGIVFSLIIVRIGLGLAPEQSKEYNSTGTPMPISLRSALSPSQNILSESQASRTTTTVNPTPTRGSGFLPRLQNSAHHQSGAYDYQMHPLPRPLEVKVTEVRTFDRSDHNGLSVSKDGAQDNQLPYQGFYPTHKSDGGSAQSDDHLGGDSF